MIRAISKPDRGSASRLVRLPHQGSGVGRATRSLFQRQYIFRAVALALGQPNVFWATMTILDPSRETSTWFEYAGMSPPWPHGEPQVSVKPKMPRPARGLPPARSMFERERSAGHGAHTR